MGAQRISQVIAMLNNFGRSQELVQIATESSGSAMEAQAIWAESLEAKLQNLSTSSTLFWQTFLSSESFGQAIDTLSGLIDFVTELVEKFGSLETAIPLLTTTMLVFSDAGRGMTKAIASTVLAKVGWLSQTAVTTLGIQTLSTATVLATAKIVAMQAVLTGGLSIAIGVAVSWVGSLVSNMKSLDEKMENSTQAVKDFKNSMESLNKTESSLNEYSRLKNIELENLALDEQEQILARISEIENNGTGISNYDSIMKSNIPLNEKEAILRRILEVEKESYALKLQESMISKKDAENYEANLNEAVNKANTWRQAIANSDGETVQVGNLEFTLENANKLLKEQEGIIQDAYVNIQQYNSDWEMVGQIINQDVTGNIITVSKETKKVADEVLGVKQGIDKVGKSTEVVVDKSKLLVKEWYEFSELLDGTKTANQNFVDLGSEIEDVSDILKDINENGLSFDNMDKVLSKFEDFEGNITNSAEVVEYLKGKITEMSDAQGTAYAEMMENDTEYFNSKVKNSQQWETYQTGVLASIKNFDGAMLNLQLDGYESLTEEKIKLAMSDLDNAESMAQARATLESKLIESLQSAWAEYYSQQMKSWQNFDSGYGLESEEAQAAWYELQKMKQQYEDMMNAFNKPIVIDMPTIKKPSTGSVGSNSSGTSSEETERIVEDLENLANIYYEVENALEDVNNALAKNKLLQEYASPKEKVALMKEEVALLKQQAQAEKDLHDAKKKQMEVQQKLLKDKGFTFDKNNDITNYQKRIKELTDLANSITDPDKKEEAIKQVEDLASAVEDYIDLVNKELPETEQAWLESLNAIKEAEREQLEFVTDIQKQIGDAITEQLRKNTEAVKSELQKQKDLYNDTWKEEDYEDSLKSEQDKLNSIQAEIDNLSRATDQASQLRLQQLMAEYEAQQKAINDMITQKEREDVNSDFDDAMEQLDKDLEDALDPENLAKLINQALTSGFVELDGQVYQTESLLTTMLENTGEAFTAVGSALKTELIDNLKTAQGLLDQISKMEVPSVFSDLLASAQSSVQGKGRSASEISFNAPFLLVEGNVTEDVMLDLDNKIQQAQNEVLQQLEKALNGK